MRFAARLLMVLAIAMLVLPQIGRAEDEPDVFQGLTSQSFDEIAAAITQLASSATKARARW